QRRLSSHWARNAWRRCPKRAAISLRRRGRKIAGAERLLRRGGGGNMRLKSTRRNERAMGVACAIALAAAIALSIASGLAHADVRPGDVITADNAARVRDLVAPGVYYKVLAGMSMKVVPSSRIDWPPPYKDATEKYSAQVR